MANVKGSKISSKITFVKNRAGDAGVERVLKAMSAEDANELRAIIDGRWYPFALYDRVLHVIVREIGGGSEAILDEIGAHSAEHQLTGIYAAYRRDDLVRMLKNMAAMHAHMNDPGRMEVTTHDRSECTIVVTEPKSTEAACRVSRAFYKRVAELAGGKHVRVDEPSCTARGDAECRFEIHAN